MRLLQKLFRKKLRVEVIDQKPSYRPLIARTILIIDDSNTDRKLYKTWLESAPHKNYNIVEAASAVDGYEALLKHQPACIILDYNMYKINGLQLMNEIKMEQADICPIILVTGMHSDEIEKEAHACGVHKYFAKYTLTQEGLYDAIEKAIA